MNNTNDPVGSGTHEAALPARHAALLLAFGVAYFALAAYAAALPLGAPFPPDIWLADGLALGALLVAPLTRWVALAGLAFVATIVIGLQAGAAFETAALAGTVNAIEPALVAAGLLRLTRGRVHIGTLPGMTAFLVNLVPLLAVASLLEASAGWLRFGGDFRSLWTSAYVSDFLSVIIVAPLVLAWSRASWSGALEPLRDRVAEVIVLFAGLGIATHLVFRMSPDTAGFVPPLAFLCSPFLIWAALRLGLRASTLAIVAFALICYWHTAHGLGPFAFAGTDWRGLIYLQGYLAAMVVTTLFAAALLAEREAAAQTTEAWRRRHKAAIEASGNLLYELDLATGQMIWDGDTRVVVGLAAEEVATMQQCMARVHPDDRTAVEHVQRSLFRGEVAHVTLEFRMQRGGGDWITVGVNGYVIDDPTRRTAGRRIVIGFVKDISERVRAETERQALAAQLKQAEKMEAVGRLAGGIAHDFNNILGAILGYGELAQARAESDPQLKKYVDTMVGAGNRAKALVSQILAYSRADSGIREPVAMGALLTEVGELLKGSKPAQVELRLALPRENAMVSGDPTRLHQLTMNLASNAVQAMPDGGVLEMVLTLRTLASPIRTRLAEVAPGDYVVLEVRDSGNGIPPEVMDRIFEPFFTTKPAGRGTGLGLALVHSVTRDHGGAIDLASEIGHGTTFTIWLPRLHGADKGEAPAQEGSIGRGQIILAVDDEPEVLAALEEMLANQGYEPAGYTDSKAALEAFRADPQRYEAVISDERMPGLTGTGLAVELRRLKPGVPIIIATGFGGEGFEARAREAGVNRVLRKPYRMHDVNEALRPFFT